jgi:hypothetical protein
LSLLESRWWPLYLCIRRSSAVGEGTMLNETVLCCWGWVPERDPAVSLQQPIPCSMVGLEVHPTDEIWAGHREYSNG